MLRAETHGRLCHTNRIHEVPFWNEFSDVCEMSTVTHVKHGELSVQILHSLTYMPLIEY